MSCMSEFSSLSSGSILPFVYHVGEAIRSFMKAKTLKKKIRRLETRLKEGPKKLAKLKRKLEALVKANEAAAKRKAAARAAAARRAARRTKVKRTLNLSPERRAQLAEAMRARWAAKRAAAAPSPRRNVGESRFHAGTGRGGAAPVRFFMAAQRSSELIEARLLYFPSESGFVDAATQGWGIYGGSVPGGAAK